MERKKECFQSMKCPVCGKAFVYSPISIYKLHVGRGLRHYCGYNCYRADYKRLYEAQELKEKEKIEKELRGEFRL